MNNNSGLHIIDNRYRILKKIGHGGMGLVYLTEDTLKDNMRFAIKTIRQNIIKTRALLSKEAFKNEYEIMTRLKHPNLTRVYDLGADMGNYYIVMEYLEGDLLSDLKISNIENKLNILVQILRALEYIHSRNIIYRDLKPKNIIIMDMKAKLMDFGLSSHIKDIEGIISGTIPYMSPETLRAEYSFSTDIFSLGILFFELIMSRTFYDRGGNVMPSIINLLKSPDKYNEFQERNLEEIKDAGLRAIIQKMTAYHPDERYIACSEIIHEINEKTGYYHEYETKETKQSYVLGNAFANREEEFKNLKSNIMGKRISNFIIYGGPSGIGKSRLFSEFRKYCRLNNIAFFESNCMEGDLKKYHSIGELLSQMITFTPDHLLDIYGRHLKLILKNDRRLDIYDPPQIMDDPKLLQEIIINNISSYIFDLSRSTNSPFILYFNDLQWIDYGSGAIIKNILYLLSINKEMNDKIYIYANINENTTFSSDKVSDILAMKEIKKLDLQSLDEKGVHEYIENIFGINYIDKSIKVSILSIKNLVGGNPLFLEEYIKSLMDCEIIIKDKKYWKLVKPFESIDIPSNITDLMKNRLKIIFKDQNKGLVLKVLSILRIDINMEIVKALFERIMHEEPAMVLLELENLEIIKSIKIDDEVYYSYGSNVMKEMVQNLIDNKQKLSQLLAETLESMPNKDNILEEIAFQYHQGNNIKKAVYYYERAGDIAGESYFNEKAFRQYEKALELLQTFDSIKKIELMHKIGDIYDLTGKLNDALKIYENALDLSEKIENTRLIIDSMNKTGWIYICLRRYDKVLTMMQKALKMSEHINYRDGIAFSAANIGIVQYSKGNMDEARKYYEKKLIIARDTHSNRGIASTTGNIGLLHFKKGDYDKAMECYEKAFDIFENIGDKQGAGTAINNIGNIYTEMGDYDKAMDYYRKKLKISEDIGDKKGASIVYGNMAYIHMQNKEYDDALRLYKKKLSISRQTGDMRGMSQAYQNLGNMYKENDDFDKSLHNYNRSIKINKENKLHYELSNNLLNKADLLYKTNRIKEAEEIIDEANEIAVQTGNTELIFQTTVLRYKIENNIEALCRIANDANADKAQRAMVYFELWNITGDTDYKNNAKEIYQGLYNNTPRKIYFKRLRSLI